jgi:hypothetical protein
MYVGIVLLCTVINYSFTAKCAVLFFSLACFFLIEGRYVTNNNFSCRNTVLDQACPVSAMNMNGRRVSVVEATEIAVQVKTLWMMHCNSCC